MTNLEYYKDEMHSGLAFCVNAHICKYGEDCCRKFCRNCEFNENMDECIKEVLAEHKEPIKLKQWEYELIDYTNRITGKECYFSGYAVLNYMKVSGYFEGISNTSMTLKEILDNCEVVED